jgi:hypothetical protein
MSAENRLQENGNWLLGLNISGIITSMEKLSPKLSCPSCRGTRLAAGQFLDASKLAPSWMLPKSKASTYDMTYFICRDCGYLGLCVSETQRAELDANPKDA